MVKPSKPVPKGVEKGATHDGKIGRDAKTGKFITESEAKRRPNTTVVETVKGGNKKK